MPEELKEKSPGAPCAEFEQRIVLYAADELEREERSEVEAHVAGCRACSASLAEERRLLENTLTELRFRFVQVSEEAGEAAPQKA